MLLKENDATLQMAFIANALNAAVAEAGAYARPLFIPT